MANVEREFYRSYRGPAIEDEDAWRLVFDPIAETVCVRHSWSGARNSGAEEFTLDEFLRRRDAAKDALITLLFDQAGAEV